MQIELWESSSGRSPVEEFLETLDERTSGKIFKKIEWLKKWKFSDLQRHAFIEKVEGTDWLYELRLTFDKVEYRFYCLINTVYYLLHAIKKKSRKARKGDIETALSRGKEKLQQLGFTYL